MGPIDLSTNGRPKAPEGGLLMGFILFGLLYWGAGCFADAHPNPPEVHPEGWTNPPGHELYER